MLIARLVLIHTDKNANGTDANKCPGLFFLTPFFASRSVPKEKTAPSNIRIKRYRKNIGITNRRILNSKLNNKRENCIMLLVRNSLFKTYFRFAALFEHSFSKYSVIDNLLYTLWSVASSRTNLSPQLLQNAVLSECSHPHFVQNILNLLIQANIDIKNPKNAIDEKITKTIENANRIFSVVLLDVMSILFILNKVINAKQKTNT